MFKLVLLSALLVAAVAAQDSTIIEAAADTPIGEASEIVRHVPAAVSHQSATIVHGRALSTPIVATSPLVYPTGSLAPLAAPLSPLAPLAPGFIAARSPLLYTARTAPLAYTAPIAPSALPAPAITYTNPLLRYIASPYAYLPYSAPIVRT